MLSRLPKAILPRGQLTSCSETEQNSAGVSTGLGFAERDGLKGRKMIRVDVALRETNKPRGDVCDRTHVE